MSIMCVLLGFHTIEVVISTPSILSDNLQRKKKGNWETVNNMENEIANPKYLGYSPQYTERSRTHSDEISASNLRLVALL